MIPRVELFGRGFLSAANVRVGWALTWRVAVIDMVASALLRGSLALLRGAQDLDVLDQLLLFAATTITALLATDWAGRRIAYARYKLHIAHFIGWAITWRHSLASSLGGVGAGLLLVGSLALARLSGAEGMQRMVVLVWVVAMLPLMMAVAIGSAGWAAHRVFAGQAAIEQGETRTLVANVRSDTPHGSEQGHSTPEPNIPPRLD